MDKDITMLSDTLLRIKLQDYGYKPGPITDTTRYLYEKKLALFANSSPETKLSNYKSIIETKTVKSPANNVPKMCSPSLQSYLYGDLSLSMDTSIAECEASLVHYYNLKINNKDSKLLFPIIKNLRKTSFNYLLIDPRKSQELFSNQGKNNLSPFKLLKIYPHFEKTYMSKFIDSIFYVGKGTQGRPYAHLIGAVAKTNNSWKPVVYKTEKNISSKNQLINEIWTQNYGVVSLHFFHNSCAREALTREAAMIDAIGITNLTNKRRGTYYGDATSWTFEKKCLFGTFILTKAMQIFMCEGERQIKPQDL